MKVTELSISDTAPVFMRDGQPTFVLAETVWGAFSRAHPDEWREFCRLRSRQGFNSVAVSVLPLAHDRSYSPSDLMPYAPRGSHFDFDRPNPRYFERARELVEIASAEGLTPILVLLWCVYVPNTWASALPSAPALMSISQRDAYLGLALSTFRGVKVVWSLGGDDKLVDSESIQWLTDASRRVCQEAPGSLMTLHGGPDVHPDTAPELHSALDFFAYQSGHGGAWVERAEIMADPYLRFEPRRPVINLEPCYEGHGYGWGTARHTSADVRRAAWTSVLAGASAGVGYGAHGVWSWHRRGDGFNGEHISGMPFSRDRAMLMPGAADVGRMRRLIECEGLLDMTSRQDLLVAGPTTTRIGSTRDAGKTVVFLPSAYELTLAGGWADLRVEAWNLATGARDDIGHRRVGGNTIFEQPDDSGDYLLVITGDHDEAGTRRVKTDVDREEDGSV